MRYVVKFYEKKSAFTLQGEKGEAGFEPSAIKIIGFVTGRKSGNDEFMDGMDVGS